MVNEAPVASACVCECAFRLKDTSSKSRLWKLGEEEGIKGKRRFTRRLHCKGERDVRNGVIHVWILN